MYFKTQWMIPRLLKQPPPERSPYKKHMEDSLDLLEKIWLGDSRKSFLVFDEISIADIMACCDLEQIRITGYDPFVNRPKLEGIWKSVKAAMNPIYDETHAICYKMAKSQQKF